MNFSNDNCPLCVRVAALLQDPEHPFLIREFEHSVFVVGDYRFFPGYSVLLFKRHARELHDLEPAIQTALFSELMNAGRAVAEAFRPWKMNYSCYGNLVPHIHWHLFPRYASDPNREQVPWHYAGEFEKHPTGDREAQNVATQIRRNLISS